MSDTRVIGATALAAASVLALTLAAPAFARSQPTPGAQPLPPASTAGQAATNLKPIRVRIYLPHALHMIKVALKRPMSFANKDMDKLVCRRGQHVGSHIPTLHCATNCQRWVQQQRIHLALSGPSGAMSPAEFVGKSGPFSTRMCDGPDGAASVSPSADYAKAETIAFVTNRASARGRASTLLGLVAKSQSRGSSYTLLVHDHGNVVAEYVVKHGKVVKLVKLRKTKSNKQ